MDLSKVLSQHYLFKPTGGRKYVWVFAYLPLLSITPDNQIMEFATVTIAVGSFSLRFDLVAVLRVTYKIRP